MVVREIVMAMIRRWYVVLAVILLATLATALFARDGGIYSTRTVVSFLLPAKNSFSPDSGSDDASVIAFAGAVAKEISGGRPAMSYSTTDAPFYGAGVRQGVLVGLPNAGNQWVDAYLRAEIEIQIVGRSRAWVQQTQSQIVAQVLTATDELQAPVVSDADRITASVEPLTLQIEHVTPDRFDQVAAASAMLLVAVIVGGSAAVLFDRLRTRSSRRRGTFTRSTTSRLGALPS